MQKKKNTDPKRMKTQYIVLAGQLTHIGEKIYFVEYAQSAFVKTVSHKKHKIGKNAITAINNIQSTQKTTL